MIQKIKKLLGKLRGDLRQVFANPKYHYGIDFIVDYKKYWDQRRESGVSILTDWQKQRANIAASIIENGSTVMDLGCGDGAILKYLSELISCKGIGVDVDRSILERASNLGIQTVYVDINDIQSIDALPVADYAMAFEILEHMPNPETLVAHLLEKVKYGIIFSVPNTGYYMHRLRLFFGKFPLQWVAHPGEHLRFWTATDMEKWVQSFNCQKKQMILYEGLPFLNKILPKLFAQGILVYLERS